MKNREREANGSAARLIQRVGTIELLTDIVRHVVIELCFEIGKRVGRRVRPAFRKEAGSFEREKVFLDHPPHKVAHVGRMFPVAELSLEPVAVEKRKEQVKVLRLAIVGRGGEEQEVPGDARQQLSQPVTPGVLDLAAEVTGGHLVCFIHNNEVPVRRFELRLQIFVAAELVETADDKIVFGEPVARSGGFDRVVRHDLESKAEALAELVLPLLDQVAGADDQGALQIAAGKQFLDEEAGHDRLTRAGVVGEQETQRLTREHLAVDRRDLMRVRIDERGVNGEMRIEEMRQVNPAGFRYQAEESAVAVESPGLAGRDGFEPRLVVAVEELISGLARCVLKSDFDARGAPPFRLEDRNDGIGEATNGRTKT